MKNHIVLGILLGLLSLNVAAEQYTISAKELSLSLQQRFPVARSYEGVEAEFSQPKLVIQNLDNEIEIEVKITVTYRGQSFVAEGLIVDIPSIQTVDNTLRFERPKLEEFFINQDNMTDSTEAIKVLKQTIGQTLPPIILLEFDQVDISLISNEPAKFSLSPQGLVLEY
tara:strand:- start:677 stop:1183 length:507 start_codon:yes stop_codon:yes gene_type:complete